METDREARDRRLFDVLHGALGDMAKDKAILEGRMREWSRAYGEPTPTRLRRARWVLRRLRRRVARAVSPE